ncbi:hypothetical protein NHX12_007226 [Muraenolepis orangiensis]|uniref:Uncharacterized protein n=1 Tax=Muraenolepis orangiensis TaxID=630683 RepID=A0A9Q0DT06_9TELE|nr:hypothetical protein NHX12_007226 [Muraenolepis orangiensis]
MIWTTGLCSVQRAGHQRHLQSLGLTLNEEKSHLAHAKQLIGISLDSPGASHLVPLGLLHLSPFKQSKLSGVRSGSTINHQNLGSQPHAT